ncbi:hypothetical protein LG634_37255 [Streptomyces bambusae]|uniref:hypothetical protein n=1 Tax=Streptomyces bambusae TaxID=1550616 RepID=UPI001CFF642B|nr:hypothetical protein [Streptomyces bambusae]MCB5170429.1 hypothetical protein [Streptomyces bambusae]
MPTRLPTVVFLCLLSLAYTSGAAFAEPGDYVLVTQNPVLEHHEDGSETVAVSLLNLTRKDAVVEAKAVPVPAQGSCTAVVESGYVLKPDRQSEVVVRLKDCTIAEGDSFRVDLLSGGTAVQVTAAPGPKPSPNWGLLYCFLWSLLGAAIVVGVTFVAWVGKARSEWARPLKYLDDSWSFKDSVASDMTLLAAAFTGVFGASGVLKALGDKTDSVMALATVGSAVGLGLVGAAPFVVQAFRKENHVTAWGLAVGTVVTMTGTAGLLWVVLLAARDLEMGDFGSGELWTLAILASALLAIYAGTNTYHSLNVGSRPDAGMSLDETAAALEKLQAEVARLQTELDQDLNALGERRPMTGAERHRKQRESLETIGRIIDDKRRRTKSAIS